MQVYNTNTQAKEEPIYDYNTGMAGVRYLFVLRVKRTAIPAMALFMQRVSSVAAGDIQKNMLRQTILW